MLTLKSHWHSQQRIVPGTVRKITVNNTKAQCVLIISAVPEYENALQTSTRVWYMSKHGIHTKKIGMNTLFYNTEQSER